MMGRGSRNISSVVVGSAGTVVSVVTAVSFTNPQSSFRSNHHRLGLGLSPTGSCSAVVVEGCVSASLAGGSFCVVRWVVGEGCASSSHSVVANFASRRFADRGVGVDSLGVGEGESVRGK